MKGALFFYSAEALNKDFFPDRPIKVLFLTSLRDIALEEFNGQYVDIDGESHYMKGVIENTLQESVSGSLKGLIEVVGVIIDDTDSDLKGRFPLLPDGSNRWIFPIDLLSKDLVWNIPSLFRKLPKGDIEARKKAKYDFEYSVFKKAQEVMADIIIVDSYMARIDHLYDFMPNKIINIHPGPTLLDKPHCFRGNDPIGDAILFAKENGGPVFTGATLHFVNAKIDDGNYIAYICNTPVAEDDSELKLMHQNYGKAKLPIFNAGLRHYVGKIFPHL